MMTRNDKIKILERLENKEEKILISNILDKAYRYERENKLFHTNFLNLYELQISTKILDSLNITYYVYTTNESADKKVIFFLPDYIQITDDFFEEYINCIKIIPNIKNKLLHKDYMGAIYSLGIKHEMIGDIFASSNFAYVFCMKNIADYLLNNLFKVANQEVILKNIPLTLDEVKNLSFNLEEKEYIIPSLRVDALLSNIYNLSRNNVKDKILAGDLYINDRNIFYPNTLIKENDIVSFKRAGKLKVGSTIRKTKSDNIVIKIFKYV